MSDTIFFTYPKAAGTLNARSRIYSAQQRTSDDFKWLVGRQLVAYASSTGGGSLGIPQEGGFGPGGLYTGGGGSGDKQGDKRLMPKPHITNIKLSSAGNFGSLTMCDLSFTCYSLAQLEANLGFCKLGETLTVSYRWSPQSAGASAGSFKGTIWNFNYSSNAQGGWDCTVKATGKGVDVVSANIKGGKAEGTVSDPSGLVVPAVDVFSKIRIKTLDTAVADLAHKSTNGGDGITTALIGCLEYATSWGASESSPEASGEAATADATQKKDEKHYYTTLESIVNIIQADIIKSAGSTLTCNSEKTKSPGLNNPLDLISANPKEVIFPGFNNYGPKHDFNFDGVTMGTGPLDSSKIMIAIDWLGTVLAEMGKTTDGQAAADFSVSKFLSAIFDSVYSNSGKRIALTLAQDPDSKTGKDWWIIDSNYGTPKPPFPIIAYVNGGVCRDIQINSALNDTMANVAFVESTGTAGGAPSEYFGDTKLGKKKTKGEELAGQRAALVELKKLFDGAETPPPAADGSPQNSGPTDANITSMQSCLAAIYAGDPKNADRTIPYPISLSVTLDGVEGFVFGNAVTTNYMPSIFKNKVYFTVTKVNHDITIGDWTTNLETVMRMLP